MFDKTQRFKSFSMSDRGPTGTHWDAVRAFPSQHYVAFRHCGKLCATTYFFCLSLKQLERLFVRDVFARFPAYLKSICWEVHSPLCISPSLGILCLCETLSSTVKHSMQYYKFPLSFAVVVNTQPSERSSQIRWNATGNRNARDVFSALPAV